MTSAGYAQHKASYGFSALVEELLQRAESACCRVYPAVCITKGMKGEELAPFMELQKAGAVALTDDGRPVENSC